MFKDLNKYKRIIVTGPQRSGTSIMSKMIAADTGYTLIDERDFGVHSAEGIMQALAMKNIVVQCPALCHLVHAYTAKDTLIVLAKREIADIVASQKRVKWGSWNKKEFKKYGVMNYKKRISEVKYDFWYNVQKELIINHLEIEYSSLSDHPLWIPKDQREDFEPKQTAI